MGLFSGRNQEERRAVVSEAAPGTPLLTFEDELSVLINKYGLESLSNTPDFILAWYLKDCLLSYNNALQRRTEWFKQKAAKEETDRMSQIAPLS